MNSTSPTVGWGIIGIGGHADSRMAPAITRASNARIAAALSRDQSRANAFAAKHSAEKAYSSFEDLLADPEVEAVYIGSPNGVHAEQTIACAKAGKHVLCDKPMSTNLDDCRRMIDACKAAGVTLAVGYNQRYQPAHVAAFDLLRTGELGEPVLAKAECAGFQLNRGREWWYQHDLAGAGSLMSTGSHAIDLLRWLLGREVVEVAALTDAGGPDQPIEEIAVACLKFEGGVFAQVDSSRKLPYPANDMSINLARGYMKFSGSIVYDTGGKLDVTTRASNRSYEFRPPRPGYDPFTGEVEHISRIVREGGTPKVTGEDGLEGLRIILAIQEAAISGKNVKIER